MKVKEVKSWHEPECNCPKMDNDDMGEHYYISSNCKLHWKD